MVGWWGGGVVGWWGGGVVGWWGGGVVGWWSGGDLVGAVGGGGSGLGALTMVLGTHYKSELWMFGCKLVLAR